MQHPHEDQHVRLWATAPRIVMCCNACQDEDACSRQPSLHTQGWHNVLQYCNDVQQSCLHAHPWCGSSPDPIIWPRHMNTSRGNPRTCNIQHAAQLSFWKGIWSSLLPFEHPV